MGGNANFEPPGREPAPGVLRLVQLFLNTADRVEDRELLRSPEDLRAWAAEVGLVEAGERFDADDLARALEFRETLRSLLVAHTHDVRAPRRIREELDRFARDAQHSLTFGADGTASLESRAPGVDRLVGAVLAAAFTAMAEGTWERLKACRNQDCQWAFFDSSKNRSGAWCSMSICGSRAKSRAYRLRKLRRATS